MTLPASIQPTVLRVRIARRALALLLPALAALAAVGLASCGGGGSVPLPQAQGADTGLRPLPAELATSKTVAYGPYRTARNDAERASEVITKAMIKQDLDLLVAGGFKLIRLYAADDKVSRQTLEVIRDNSLPLKVMQGIWISGYDAAGNNAEIARGIKLANDFKSIVVAVSVGNEAMVSWSGHRIAASAMVPYLKQVRAAITQPVTTDDNWAFFGGPVLNSPQFYEQDPEGVLGAIDFVAMHVYPGLDTLFDLYEWRFESVPAAQRATAMMNAAMERAKKNYADVRAKMAAAGYGGMPVIIGETGWQAVDTGGRAFISHPANQKIYYDALNAWVASGTGPKGVVHFVAFDEPWKQGDDKWGFFTVDRKARFVVKDLYPESLWLGAGTGEPATATVKLSDAVYFVPLVVNAAVTANRFTLYADATPAGEARLGSGWWDAFGSATGGTASYAPDTTTSAPGDGNESTRITPIPSGYWGLLRQSCPGRTPTGPCATATSNLSGFANGSLNVWIKTNNYPGKIEIGIASDTENRTGAEAYLQLSPGNFGYCNTNAWCQVTIPVAEFLRVNPKLDLRAVTLPFIIADRFNVTGKPQNTSGLPAIYVDGVFWSK
jgi:exo-beta-1,3-glucanase (GH17 family)